MNHHTSSKQKRSVSNNGNMKKMQNVRNCNTHSNIAFHPISNLDKHMPKYGLDLTSPFMVHSPWLLEGLATITQSPVDPPEVQTDIKLVETLVEDTATLIGVVKVVGVAMAVAHILHKDGVVHHLVLVVCLVLVPGVEAVGTELVVQTILKMVHMVVLVLVGGQT